MKEKRKKILLSIIGILLLVLVTVGVTVALFTYTRLGTTENTITTGSLKFLYIENTGVGNGISMTNAFPVTDDVGKEYDTENYVFDFKVEATNSGNDAIPYEVTLRKKGGSTLADSNVKIYLTDMTQDADNEIVAPTLYSDLVQTTIDVEDEVEKTLYEGTVPGGENNYEKDFRLRMWIKEDAVYSEIGGQTFTALVNVYSNVPLVSQEEIDLRNNTEISNLSIDDNDLELETNYNYNYEVAISESTNNPTINIETKNPNATVEIEKVNNTGQANNVKRIANTNKLELTKGNNEYKIKVTSENKQTTTEYTMNVIVGYDTLDQSVSEVVSSFDSSTLKDAVLCNKKEDSGKTYYYSCRVYNTVNDAIAAKNNSAIILTNDTDYAINGIEAHKNLSLDLNGKNMNLPDIIHLAGNLEINDETKQGVITSSNTQPINIGDHGRLTIDYANFDGGTDVGAQNAIIWIASTCNGCELIINDANMNHRAPMAMIAVNDTSKNAKIIINGGRFNSEAYAVLKSTGNSEVTINGGYFISNSYSVIINNSTETININGGEFIGVANGTNSSEHGDPTINHSTGTINITGNTVIKNNGTVGYANAGITNNGTGLVNIKGSNAVFDDQGNYKSGILIETVAGQGIRNAGTLKFDGGTIKSGNNAITNLGDNNVFINNGIFNSNIRNENAGVIKICNAEVNYSDLNNTGSILANNRTGYIYYKSNVVLSNNTFNNPSNIILDDSIVCTE